MLYNKKKILINVNKEIITDIYIKEKILNIKFMSVKHDKIFPIYCSKSDTIVKLEEIFYIKYLEYKEYNTYLTVNGNSIKRFKTIEENGIKEGNDIIVNIYEK